MTFNEKQYYPLLFEPVLKDYIWGGRNLETRLGRELPADTNIAESWEISAHPNGDVVVRNGPYAGQTLSEVHRALGSKLIGSRGEWAQERGKFPLLIKLLDANRALSVQVHPNDDYAQSQESGELGKTEMWVVLHAEEDAAVILGVKNDTTSQQFKDAIEAGNLEPLLHKITVRENDFICVPSGSLHAILGGLLIAEIQQNSDVTYRVYDWNRVGPDGKRRPLHVDKALDVINFEQVEPQLAEPRLVGETTGMTRWALCHNQYFVVERIEMEPGATFTGECDGSTLEILGVIKGNASIVYGDGSIPFPAVNFALMPAAMGHFAIEAAEAATLLRAYLP